MASLGSPAVISIGRRWPGAIGPSRRLVLVKEERMAPWARASRPAISVMIEDPRWRQADLALSHRARGRWDKARPPPPCAARREAGAGEARAAYRSPHGR